MKRRRLAGDDEYREARVKCAKCIAQHHGRLLPLLVWFVWDRGAAGLIYSLPMSNQTEMYVSRVGDHRPGVLMGFEWVWGLRPCSSYPPQKNKFNGRNLYIVVHFGRPTLFPVVSQNRHQSMNRSITESIDRLINQSVTQSVSQFT